MEKRKLTKEDIDKVRDIEGFPIGTDEDIIALSDAPYYMACPNPFIEEFINENGAPYDEETDDYHREPFASDVSEGKKEPIYNAHSYHTKVPFKAIMRYIHHYTNPGDVVFDGFAGTGMTGVAAQMFGGNNPSLEYELTGEFSSKKWGTRKAVISDLSPMASFISSIYNMPTDFFSFKNSFEQIYKKVSKECEWMYQTVNENGKTCHVNYVVYSDVFICPHCGKEVVFWDRAVDKETGGVKNEFTCQSCNAVLTKKACERAKTSYYDSKIDEIVSTTKQIPVLISYQDISGETTKSPDEYDLELERRINEIEIPYWYPTDRMIEGGESRRNDKYGITHVHHFFTKRNLYVLAALWNEIDNSDETESVKFALKSVVTGVMQGVSKLQRFRLNSGFPNMILSGTLYVGSMIREWNVLDWVKGKYKSIEKLKGAISSFKTNNIIISTNSLTDSRIPNNSIDYVFTDPPFGSNLNYSELSFIWEAWLRVKTNNKEEAIINIAQNKALLDYQNLMEDCFREYYRTLKPNRWMTVEFHNSQNSVWNAIQEAIQKAGFIIADVRTLNKKQESFKQITSQGAVKQDLVISAYKPKESFMRKMIKESGTEETAWAFVRQYLENLPVAVVKENSIEVIAERQPYLLFDRMVAYHITNGLPVPIDAPDFYKKLDEKFLKRDEMYFLPSQVNEYDTVRIKNDIEDIQYILFVNNEKSAIAWLYQLLDERSMGPQTYSEIQPKFMQEVKSVEKYEQIPELSILLEENFLKDESGRWYIPDRTKEADIAKLREKNLLKEFDDYFNSKGKLKLFRSEAVKAGFSKLWKDKNYKAIVNFAERLPEQVIQEDPNLLMYYDISLSRIK